MMGDLVERLKKVGHIDYALMDEAASTILRLQEENARLRGATIEECAKVAETGDWYGQFQTAGDERRARSIASRIRSLSVEEEKR